MTTKKEQLIRFNLKKRKTFGIYSVMVDDYLDIAKRLDELEETDANTSTARKIVQKNCDAFCSQDRTEVDLIGSEPGPQLSGWKPDGG